MANISNNESNETADAVRLLGFVMDMFNEQQQQWREHQSDWLANNRSTDVDQVQVGDATTTSTDRTIEELQLLMPVWAYQSAAAYLIFISVLGLFMNIVVVLVIVSDPQRMTPLNWMLLNLACSDGTIAGFGTTISTAAAFKFGWPFSDELCVAYAMIMSTAGIGSITTLTALALWRCQLVVYCPAKRSGAFANHHSGGGGGGSAKLGRVQAAVLLTLIWAYSLAVTCPPLFGWGRYDREAAHISCSVNWESKMANNRSYILYMFAFGLFVPLVVIISSYVSILRVVKKTGKFKRTTLQQSTQQQNEQRITPDLQEVKQQNLNNNQQPTRTSSKSNSDAAEKRVTVMVACMVGAFMAAWTPYSILALFETFIGVAGHSGGPGRNMSNTTLSLDGQQQFNDNQPTTSNEADDSHFFYYYVGTISPAFATIPSLFAKTSAVLNPLIYGLLNTQFRSAWDKFVIRFLGRSRRRFRCQQTSQGLDESGNQTERRRLRRLLDFSFTMKQSVTVNLPMREVVPLSNNDSINSTGNQQQKSTSFRNVRGASANSPLTSVQAATQYQSNGDQNRKISSDCDYSARQPKYRESVNPFVGTTATSGLTNSKFPPGKKSSKNSHRNSRQQQPQSEQPVKLVVVRLLSDSTSCCYTTEETSVSLNSPAIGRSPSSKSQANKANSLPRPNRQVE
ncbi:opsin-3-like [Daphnia pulex]|uniref:opsin-3-like n=1 Tax=Daphnia pulex TaxID=6669 RepID=UPI001EE10755|nr:opsin-3-like [Daphnia pulex]